MFHLFRGRKFMVDLENLPSRALKLGARESKIIFAREIIVKDWVRLKCKYGCGGYGERLTCPPYSPTPEETRRIISGYERALLMCFRSCEECGTLWL
jgi:predicted metal-binding protein